MSRTVKVGLIQAADAANDPSLPVKKIQDLALEKHVSMIHEAGKKGVQILGLQEIYNGPYFCPSKDPKWCDQAESIPGPTVEEFQKLAKQYAMAIVVPIYEREMAGVYYNSAAVIDADGTYLGKYRKSHILQCGPGSGRSTSSSQAISVIPSSRRGTRRSASTSATTATSRKARGCSD